VKIVFDDPINGAGAVGPGIRIFELRVKDLLGASWVFGARPVVLARRGMVLKQILARLEAGRSSK